MGMWITENWFVLLQSAGIIGSLLFTAVSLKRNTATQKVETWFRITSHHRDLWMEILERPELARIRETESRLKVYPLTEPERRFVQLLIHQLAATYVAIQAGVISEPAGLRNDIAQFFSFPVPKAVWDQAKQFQESQFVGFVEEAIKTGQERQE